MTLFIKVPKVGLIFAFTLCIFVVSDIILTTVIIEIEWEDKND